MEETILCVKILLVIALYCYGILLVINLNDK